MANIDNYAYDMSSGISPEEYNSAYSRRRFGGQASAVAGGVGALYGQFSGIHNRYNGLQTQAPSEQLDAYGRPLYNLGDLAMTQTVNPKGANAGDILSGAASGASAGAAFGPAGAAIGGFIGGVGSWLAGRSGKRRGEQRKRLAASNLKLAQNTYSKDMMQFNNSQLGMGSYNQLNNNYSRVQNLWDIESGNQPNG